MNEPVCGRRPLLLRTRKKSCAWSTLSSPTGASLHFARLLWAAAFLFALRSEASTPVERGREIYLRGMNSDGATIVAAFGQGGAEVGGAAVPCGSCHGRNGRG